jgi:hypothetical protein
MLGFITNFLGLMKWLHNATDVALETQTERAINLIGPKGKESKLFNGSCGLEREGCGGQKRRSQALRDQPNNGFESWVSSSGLRVRGNSISRQVSARWANDIRLKEWSQQAIDAKLSTRIFKSS